MDSISQLFDVVDHRPSLLYDSTSNDDIYNSSSSETEAEIEIFMKRGYTREQALRVIIDRMNSQNHSSSTSPGSYRGPTNKSPYSPNQIEIPVRHNFSNEVYNILSLL